MINRLAVMLLLICTLLCAAPLQTNVTLVSAGSLQNSNGILVGPYTVSFNNVTYKAMCFDFVDTVNVGQTWLANEDTFSDMSQVYFQNVPNYVNLYKEEVYLYTQLTKPGVSNSDRIGIQQAGWNIFAPGSNSGGSTAFWANAATNALTTNFAGMGINFDNYVILTSPLNTNPHIQGFIVDVGSNVPEPSTLLGCGIGLLLLGAFRFNKRSA